MTVIVADEQEVRRELARLAVDDQLADLRRRVKEKTLDPVRVKQGLQPVIEDRWDRAQELPYADERVSSTLGYPEGFRWRSAEEQVEVWRAHSFVRKLDASQVGGIVKRQQDSSILPAWVEGVIIAPKFSRLGGYHPATTKLFGAISHGRPTFQNWRGKEISDKRYFRPIAKTAGCLWQLDEYQPGDFLVIPVNLGLRWRGASIRHGRVRYEEREFGLCHYLSAAAMFTHPDRITDTGGDVLWLDCTGTEYAPDAGGDFYDSAVFGRHDEHLVFGYRSVDAHFARCGSAVGFLPQC